MNKSTSIAIAIIILAFCVLPIIVFCTTPWLSNERSGALIDSDTQKDICEIEQDVESETTQSTEETTFENYEIVYAIGLIDVYADINKERSIGSIEANTEIQRISESDNGWSKIVYEDGEAYVLSEQLTDIKDNIVNSQNEDPTMTKPLLSEDGIYTIVNEEVRAIGNVFIRSGPSTNNKKIGILAKNAHITRIGVGSNGWSKVTYKDGEAYIISYYLDLTEEPTYTEVNEVVYTTKDTNVRTGPSIRHKKIDRLKKGTEITRIEVGNNGWSKVAYGDDVAYMYSLYLATEPVLETIAPKEVDQIETTSSSVEKRKDEEESSSIATTPEQIIENSVSDKLEDETIEIEEMFVEPEGLILEEVAYIETNDKVYARTHVNVRMGPGAECEKIGTISKGQAITRIGIRSDEWSVVIYNGIEAFVYSRLLTTIKPT